jgi:thiol-disulfide isomerase/thioredoxin
MAVACGLAISACASGPIAVNTPKSNGASFVTGNTGAQMFKPGDRPAAPDISGTTLSGSKLSLSAYRGTVVVLNFWGSWCSPCRAEAPALAALSQKYASRGVRFLGIDIRDSPASAEAFMRDYGIRYPSLNDPSDELALAFRDTVPPGGIPTTLLIDRSGHIAGRIIGESSYSGLSAMLADVTAGSS